MHIGDLSMRSCFLPLSPCEFTPQPVNTNECCVYILGTPTTAEYFARKIGIPPDMPQYYVNNRYWRERRVLGIKQKLKKGTWS